MEAIFEILGGILFIQTGRAVVWALSLGQWRGEGLTDRGSLVEAPAGALSYVHDGQRIITQTGVYLAGVAFYAGLIAAVVYVMVRG